MLMLGLGGCLLPSKHFTAPERIKKMAFAIGSCCLLHPPIPHCSLFSIPSSSRSICFFSPLKMAQNRRKNIKVSASMDQESRNERNLCARRVILFVGFSVLPVLKMTATALQSLASECKRKSIYSAQYHIGFGQHHTLKCRSLDGSDLEAPEQDQRAEKKPQGDASENPFVSVLGGLGILVSGVLAALYALTLKEKVTSEATIESMRNRMKEKEATIVSMKKKFESDLMKEKEVGNQQVIKVREEQQLFISQLKSANDTIVGVGQELQKERKVVEELKISIDGLQNDLMKAGEDKKELQEILREKLESLGVLQERINFLTGEIKDKDDNLHSLSSALTDKEMQLDELKVMYQQLQDQLAGLSSENEELKDKLLRNEKELELKRVAVDDLNVQVSSLLAEKDESNRKFDSIQREYNNLKSSSEKKAAEDAKLLEDQAHTLRQFEQQLDSTLSEMSRSKVLVTDLSQERDDLRKMLDLELSNVESLEQELHITRENLEKSKNEAAELARQLQQSRDICFGLEAEVSRVRADFAEAKKSLQKTTEEARRGAEILAGELTSVKELLKKSTEEKHTVSRELAAVAQSHNDLQKELVGVYKKAETAANDLLEEKSIVASLKKELKALETQISKETEVRKSLQRDLEEAARSLDEINHNALILSRELELANTQMSSIEDEKDALYKSLAEQKHVSQEARENMEDAHSLIMQLGQERESFEKRAKKLENELASAKGEILRLRSQMNSSTTNVNDHQHQQTAEVGAKAAVPVKRTRRRRKIVEQQDDS